MTDRYMLVDDQGKVMHFGFFSESGTQRYLNRHPEWKMVALEEAKPGEPSCGWTTGWEQGCPVKAPCPYHSTMTCFCGKPSTHGCSMTGQFVCGHPLCDDHRQCSSHGRF